MKNSNNLLPLEKVLDKKLDLCHRIMRIICKCSENTRKAAFAKDLSVYWTDNNRDDVDKLNVV